LESTEDDRELRTWRESETEKKEGEKGREKERERERGEICEDVPLYQCKWDASVFPLIQIAE